MPPSELDTASADADSDTPASDANSSEANEDMDEANTGLLDQTRSTLLRFLGLLFLGFPWRAEPVPEPEPPLEHDVEAGITVPPGRVEGSPGITRETVIRRRGARAALAQQTSEVAKRIQGVLIQCYASCLPACALSYPVLKDAPDSVKLVMYGGLASITTIVYIGLLSKSVARARLAIRLVSCIAVTVLTFSVASQLSVPTYALVLVALAGCFLNLAVFQLPF